jgi:hypothetical protein
VGFCGHAQRFLVPAAVHGIDAEILSAAQGSRFTRGVTLVTARPGKLSQIDSWRWLRVFSAPWRDGLMLSVARSPSESNYLLSASDDSLSSSLALMRDSHFPTAPATAGRPPSRRSENREPSYDQLRGKRGQVNDTQHLHTRCASWDAIAVKVGESSRSRCLSHDGLWTLDESGLAR